MWLLDSISLLQSTQEPEKWLHDHYKPHRNFFLLLSYDPSAFPGDFTFAQYGFFKYILLIMLLQLSHFTPFIPLCPAQPLPPTFPPFSSCPWVIHVSSLVSTFPILFLTLPLSIFYLPFMLLILCTFPPSLPIPLPCWQPSMWSPFLWFCSCSSCLLSLLLFLF